ncbi:hypothetical protein ACFL6I_20040 [candidate division KSB1 bacterium]
MKRVHETPDANLLRDSLPDSARQLIHDNTFSLVNKLYKRRHDIWANVSPQASVNSQDEYIEKEIQRVFSPEIKMKKFIKALQKIYPTLPEEQCIKVYRLFKFISWRREKPLPLP